MPAPLPPDPGLRARVLAHLGAYPAKTFSVYDLARVLGQPDPKGTGKDAVLRELAALEAAGEAARETEQFDECSAEPVTRWRIT
jgi:hypothetical protein